MTDLSTLSDDDRARLASWNPVGIAATGVASPIIAGWGGVSGNEAGTGMSFITTNAHLGILQDTGDHRLFASTESLNVEIPDYAPGLPLSFGVDSPLTDGDGSLDVTVVYMVIQ